MCISAFSSKMGFSLEKKGSCSWIPAIQASPNPPSAGTTLNPNPSPQREHNSHFPQIWEFSIRFHFHAQVLTNLLIPSQHIPPGTPFPCLQKLLMSQTPPSATSKLQLHLHRIFDLTILSLEWCHTSIRTCIFHHSWVVGNFPNFSQPYFFNLPFFFFYLKHTKETELREHKRPCPRLNGWTTLHNKKRSLNANIPLS